MTLERAEREYTTWHRFTDAPEAISAAILGLCRLPTAAEEAFVGDWEFGYWQPQSGMLSGSEESAYCGGCHAGSATDFVFLDHSWRQR